MQRDPPLSPPCVPGQSELDHLLNAARCGEPLVRIDKPDGEYLVHRPDAVQHVLQKRHRNYTSVTPAEPIMGRSSLAMSHGEVWRRRRRLLQPFFQPGRLVALSHHITAVIAARLERWQSAAERGESLSIDREMVELSLDTLLVALFGNDANSELKCKVNETFLFFNARARQEELDHRKLERALESMHVFLRFHLAKRRSRDPSSISGKRQEDDILAWLLNAHDSQSGAALGDDELIDELMMMMVMGHMSTAMGLTWASYLLALHPRERERLTSEMEDDLGSRAPSARDLEHLPRLSRFLDESLRLYPPGWAFARRAVENDTIDGIAIPAGAILVLSPWVTHRRPDLWDDPERFDPDRFSPDRAAGRHPFAYFPFGGGPRNCIGVALARIQSELILAHLAWSFRPELFSEDPVEPEPNIVLMPRDGLVMALRPPQEDMGTIAS